MLMQPSESNGDDNNQSTTCANYGRLDLGAKKQTRKLTWWDLRGCGALVLLVGALLWVMIWYARHNPTPTRPVEPLVLGAEYVVTGTNWGIMDSPRFYYPDLAEFEEHLILILVPGDVIVPRDLAGIAALKVRVASHNGTAVYIVGYTPLEVTRYHCRLKNPQP